MDEARFSTDTKTYYSRCGEEFSEVVIDEKVTKMESALKAYRTRGRGSSKMRKLVFRMQKTYTYCQRQFL